MHSLVLGFKDTPLSGAPLISFRVTPSGSFSSPQPLKVDCPRALAWILFSSLSSFPPYLFSVMTLNTTCTLRLLQNSLLNSRLKYPAASSLFSSHTGQEYGCPRPSYQPGLRLKAFSLRVCLAGSLLFFCVSTSYHVSEATLPGLFRVNRCLAPDLGVLLLSSSPLNFLVTKTLITQYIF